jgi:hypothetical protein
MLIDRQEEFREGDQIVIVDFASGESRELPAEVVEIRRILGKPAYLVETASGERKLVGAHQLRRKEHSG